MWAVGATPDGKRIAYGSLRNGKWGLYQTDANGTGEETLLLESANGKGTVHACGWGMSR